jgi:2-polyprenyl-3-methyl-5-hydroxy-6-metoxy-1,4-benzoquinol methylase
MKILVAIANYGTSHDGYLDQLLTEYRSMRHEVHIVVLSNLPKSLGPDVEVVVGLPTSNPWSLPFGHKKIFAERVNDYDLFIYSEDDHLISEHNIDSFMALTPALPRDEVAGFMVSENDPEGGLNYCGVHSHFHWKADSVRHRGSYVVAEFSNEHSACYALTRAQLHRAIQSGGFLVEPHEGKYDLLCTAATDPYTQCGFKRVVCVSHLDDFIVSHLPNKYVGILGVRTADFHRQRDALLEIARGQRNPMQLLAAETTLPDFKWSKFYYEPVRPEILKLVPPEARSVLSVGCGWGALEASLVEKGARVVAIPLDSVIASCAESRGVETLSPDFESAWRQLEGEPFDCVVISNILHLLPDPTAILARCADVLLPQGFVVLIEPNFTYLKVLWRRIRRMPGYRNLGNYDEAGVNLTTHRVIRRWLKSSGLAMDRVIEVVPERAVTFTRLLRVARPYLASELIVVGRKAVRAHQTVGSQRSESQSESERRFTVPV